MDRLMNDWLIDLLRDLWTEILTKTGRCLLVGSLILRKKVMSANKMLLGPNDNHDLWEICLFRPFKRRISLSLLKWYNCCLYSIMSFVFSGVSVLFFSKNVLIILLFLSKKMALFGFRYWSWKISNVLFLFFCDSAIVELILFVYTPKRINY